MKKNGFTLIELMIVIAIIGIIAAVAAPAISNRNAQQQTFRDRPTSTAQTTVSPPASTCRTVSENATELLVDCGPGGQKVFPKR